MTDPTGQPWTLYRGDELIADLVVNGGDFPWLNADVRPHPGFEDVRPLFDEELRLLADVTTTSRNGRPRTRKSAQP
jgi:hypothetical protein